MKYEGLTKLGGIAKIDLSKYNANLIVDEARIAIADDAPAQIKKTARMLVCFKCMVKI